MEAMMTDQIPQEIQGSGLPATGAPRMPAPAQPVEDARTLYVAKLPEDVKEREGHNLFRFFPGYEGCDLYRAKDRAPVMFVHFSDHESAAFARSALFGLKFEPSSPQPMQISYMRTKTMNTRKRLPPDFLTGEYNKKLKVTQDQSPLGYSILPIAAPYGTAHVHPAYAAAYAGGYVPQYAPYAPQTASPTPFPATSVADAANGGQGQVMDPSASYPKFQIDPSHPLASFPPHLAQEILAGLPPIAPSEPRLTPDRNPTSLFVGNLAKSVLPEELTSLFSHFPGFTTVRFKYNPQSHHPVAFIDFADAASAKTACILDGFLMGGTRIRLTYAKNLGGKDAPDTA